MSYQQVTITLPERVYQQIRTLSQERQRSIAEEVVAAVTAALPVSIPDQEQLPPDLAEELNQLEQLSDAELWRAARMLAPVEKTERMQQLVEKQQLEGLTTAEKEEAALLSHFFNRIMLVRAKAAVLLKKRGHDVDSLINN